MLLQKPSLLSQTWLFMALVVVVFSLAYLFGPFTGHIPPLFHQFSLGLRKIADDQALALQHVIYRHKILT